MGMSGESWSMSSGKFPAISSEMEVSGEGDFGPASMLSDSDESENRASELQRRQQGRVCVCVKERRQVDINGVEK